jgi:hypothetical protein
MTPAAGTTRPAPPVWRVTTARRAHSARPALAVGASLGALVLLTVGITLGRASGGGHAASPKSEFGQQGVERPGRTTGSDRTEHGAVAAATAYLAALSTRAYITDPIARADTIRAIVVPADRDRLATQAADATGAAGSGSALAAAFGPPRSSAWRLAPAGYRLDTFTTDRAVVEIWAVQVTAGTGTVDVPATATWTTTRLPLLWTQAGWKLDLAAATVAPGPTPGMGPMAQSSDLEVIAADGQFEEYRHDPR